ncbi:glycosyltransferase family 4 protein [Rubrimonas sp.]|uniref:glycosyltransferase family 4 protein n=1 Tax=Rubrimonas sp. TaxID=2036015 RepID=UPI002FDE203E
MNVVSLGARAIPNVEGGAEKNAEMIFPRIAQRHRVTLLCLSKFVTTTNFKDVHIVPVSSFSGFGTDKFSYYLICIFEIFRRRPDIIHCQGLNAAIFLFLYKLISSKIVVRYGSADYLNKKWGPIGRLGFRLCEWQLRLADAVIAVTPSLRDRLIDRGVTDRVVVIPNAIDPVEETPAAAAPAALGLEPGRFVLSVGRVTWQKDYETLLSAFAAAKARRPDIGKLVIVGGDDGSGYLQKLEDMGVRDVVFAGRLPRSDVAAFYAHCALYVNSSVHEGLSNAILEAVSHRAPLVLSDIVENRDLPLEAHHFFPTGDADALAGRMLAALDAPAAFRVDLGKFFDWDEVAARTMALYDLVMAGGRPGRPAPTVFREP